MQKQQFKFFLLFIFSLFLTSCALFEKDNTPPPSPLVTFSPTIQPRLLWRTQTASRSTQDEYLKLNPVGNDSTIFTTGGNNIVTATNQLNGQINWQVNAGISVTTGPGIGNDAVAVGSRTGDIVVMNQSDGKIRWKTNLKGAIFAAPAIQNNIVVVKTMDGYLHALSLQDGHELWSLQQVEPNLILRGASAPLIRDRKIIAGFENGNLAKLSLNNGDLDWLQPITVPQGAFAIQRMIDIDADPVLYGHDIYAATYQGKIAALDWNSGNKRWTQDISSYTGMIADSQTVYISDAKGDVWAFDSGAGEVKWHQTKLEARLITGPAIISNYIVVGDAQGYLHWLDEQDGHFVARTYMSSPLYTAPIVKNNVLYVLAINGSLSAYTVN